MASTHYSNLLYCLCFDRSAFPDIYLKEANRLDKQLTARATPYQTWPKTRLKPHQPLRIGLVSGDLHNHPVSYFLESIIYHLNPEKVQLFAYTTRHIEDELTARIKPYFEQWTDITTLNDITAAQKIHNDGIHILIDLAGHTAFNRLPIFAWKPAPIQVSWLGYFASTGLSFIDYFLADPIAVPESNLKHFSEHVWYLPYTRLCFTPPAADIYQEQTPLPADRNGFITFGCFQSLSKINHKMVSLWANILQECPNSKLMFKNNQLKDRAAKQELIDKLIVCQITMDRVIFAGGSPREAYLSTYGLVDFMLDTSPYPGGTTTCEALWMGVPTLTLTGDTLLEKQGMGMLTCVGLQDWVAYNEDDYTLKAITHAKNINNLRQLRLQLRETMKKSPLVDATRFAKHLESVLEQMWTARDDT
jgi:predicted O-linked N-acetylglucosamine transferase (SPINDLY family)